MSAPYQVNLAVEAGTDFSQEFVLTGPDLAPIDITGHSFSARLAKHPTAIDAVVSTSGSPIYAYTDFSTVVVDGNNGKYSITMDSTKTSTLSEGKYVYNVVMKNGDGTLTTVLSGLAFVDVAFGSTRFSTT